ncbi:ATP-dependent DNA helicase RecG [Geoalkalibacter subterraneus]|uniref:ATP-dependent DNA helicase RecG n=1 Tax=Geoalkalibacter subterraneus TaxID=483547 RepID=A0A0B5FPT7_9BACT|nr:ATP-dependent DNA helicase RecG [Geoalkalibacter subterraneus]AJF06674.1 ATP-dependent DNA helicase RecG [Geoalkalibacter subterraneus]
MPPKPNYARSRELLATSLAGIKGVGPKLEKNLAKAGLATVEDVLYTLPLRYEDRRQIRRISQLRDGHREVFVGEVLAAGETTTPRARKRLFEVIVGDGTGQVSLKWFRYHKAWLSKRFAVGTRAVFTGEVKRFGAAREVHHPDVELLGSRSLEEVMAADPLSFGRVLPVYPLTEGLSQKVARKIFKQVVDAYAPLAVSPVPPEILKKNNLLPLDTALRECHWPEVGEDEPFDEERGPQQARSSLVFDEFFFLELGLALKRRGIILERGMAFEVNHVYTKPLAAMLPFRLTEAQRRVLGEIKHDMMAIHPMHRLVQGDVGCGKTIVALMAALVAIENDTQVALIAPTEILAEQHYIQFHQWLDKLGLKAVLLSGSLSAKEKQAVYEEIREGRAHLVVGTHAVLQEGVDFKRLGLGIIDEQHRFGVVQRGVLRHKGDNPDILVMTATPIPRTLSLTLYGDLSVSVIDQMPPGRSPVKTRVVSESQRKDAYIFIRKQIEEGRQAYIVFPLVEESEKSDLLAATQAAEQLAEEVFHGLRVGLLHGRMKPAEKEGVMTAFKAGEIHALVSTTVIEVGVDVSNATVMMVEHAERFGLAQLHQLRGRVGRGSAQSYCLLVRSKNCSEDGARRLKVMSETTDGFRIAEADLEIRGPGEFLGTRQAGLPDFRVANLLRDGRILEQARQEAFALAADPDFDSHPKYADTRQALLDRWGSRLELASIG